jgi:hypothetical protein
VFNCSPGHTGTGNGERQGKQAARERYRLPIFVSIEKQETRPVKGMLF